MKPISKITLAVNELGARPEGCSVTEVMLASGCKRNTAQARMFRQRKTGRLFMRSGIDGGGILCQRHFTTQEAASAYVFEPGYYDQRIQWTRSARVRYVGAVAANPAITYAALIELLGVTVDAGKKTLSRLIAAGYLFVARRTGDIKNWPVSVLFTTEQARDEWQAANPFIRLGHSEPRQRREPKTTATKATKPIKEPRPKAAKAPKEPKVKATRSPKKTTKRSALSVVKRKDSRIAEVRAGLSRKAFEPTKPRGNNIAIPHSAAQKVTVREGYPDHKFWIDPNSVPVFRYGSAVAA